MPDTPLIPRRVLFGNPDRYQPTVSPDGRHLAWLAPLDGVLNVFVAPRTAPSEARPVTRDSGRGIRMYRWLHTGRHLVYQQDEAGDENWHLYATDVTRGETRDLTPLDGVHAILLRAEAERPDKIVVGLNDREPSLHDLHLVHVPSGERTLLLRNDGFAEILVDAAYQPRFAAAVRPDGGVTVHRHVGGRFEQWLEVPPEDALTTGLVEVSATEPLAYLIDSVGRDTSALVEVDLADGSRRVLAEDSRSDVAEIVSNPRTHRPEAAAFRYLRKTWTSWSDEVTTVLSTVGEATPGEIEILSRSLDDRWWTVAVDVDDGPRRFYLYGRESASATLLFSASDALEDQPLVPMHPRAIGSRDGLELVSYLSLPAEADPDQDGIPETPLPLVLVPHGGPWARDIWGYDATHQWLANRGYAVLSVNFRSSTGFGKEFTNAGDLEWGGKILADQIDAVRWAIREGVADAEEVAVLGGSFGGYSVLAGLTMHPDVFACGVDIVGPSNLFTLLESVPEYWKPMLDVMKRRVGDPDSEEGRALLERHSPLSHVASIRAPLLIAQGANDPRVKRAESDQIVQAMKERGIPVQYVLFPDEGHGFARPENRIAFYALAERFLADVLGGRVEAMSDELEHSSAQILEGR